MSRKRSGSSRGSSPRKPLPDNVVSLAARRRRADTPIEQYRTLAPEFAAWLMENAGCPANQAEEFVVSVAHAISSGAQRSP